MSINQDKEFCWWCGREEGTDVHHLFQRSTSPHLKTDKNNLMVICRSCHTYATNSPEFAELLQKTFFNQPRPEKISMEYIAKTLSIRKYFSPNEVVQFRNFLAGEYYFYSSMYADAEMEKAQLMVKERKNYKSKTDTEDFINTLDCGQNAIKCKRLLDAMEQMQSALFTQIMQMNKEYKISN